jgi:hypothetical protein
MVLRWNWDKASSGWTNRAETTSWPPSGVGRNCCLLPALKPSEGVV